VQEFVAAEVTCCEMLMLQNFDTNANQICWRFMCCRSGHPCAIALKLLEFAQLALMQRGINLRQSQPGRVNFSVVIPADPLKRQRQQCRKKCALLVVRASHIHQVVHSPPLVIGKDADIPNDYTLRLYTLVIPCASHLGMLECTMGRY